MSKIKISENLFLEKNELNRMVKFMSDDGYKKLFKAVVNRYGIVRNNGEAFRAFKKSETEIVVSPGLAVTPDADFISLPESVTIGINRSSTKKWITIRRAVTNIEVGTVSVDRYGTLSGSGTKFLEVLRGQPNFPVRVSFPNSKLNKSEYSVVEVSSDTKALIFGSLVEESGLKMEVIGTFTPGFIPSSNDKKIYEYDYCSFNAIESESVPTLSDGEFFVASIVFSGDKMYVSDERQRNMLNETYTANTTEGGTSSASSTLSMTTLKSVSLVSRFTAPTGVTNSLLELEFEHAYFVDRFEVTSNEDGNVLKILEGRCNFLASADVIPDNSFSGCRVVNMSNGKSVVINSNNGSSLILANADFDVLQDGASLMVVQISQRGDISISVNGLVSSVAEMPLDVPRSKMYLNITSRASQSDDEEFDVSLSIRGYDITRDALKNSIFTELPVSSFTNIDGEEELLAGSSFKVTKKQIDPEEAKRNYS